MKQVPFLFEVEPDAKVLELTHASFLNWITLNREKTAKRRLNIKGYCMAYFYYNLWEILFFKTRLKSSRGIYTFSISLLFHFRLYPHHDQTENEYLVKSELHSVPLHSETSTDDPSSCVLYLKPFSFSAGLYLFRWVVCIT